MSSPQGAIKEKLQLELDELESELRIHLPKEIKRALEFGDLRENSEYRAALEFRDRRAQESLAHMHPGAGGTETVARR